MAKISHFVVTYNHETKEWNLDSESVQSLGGATFDTASEEWENLVDGSEEQQIDTQAGIILFDSVILLGKLNG